MAENYFAELYKVNCNENTEVKNGLTYLSWAFAWAEIKKRHPDAVYNIYEDANGRFYHTDGKTCWVKTGVTVNGIEHIEYLPVMDYKNKSIAANEVTSFDVNKSVQRSLTKACARHGLGLYIYAGEDLPEGEKEEEIHCDVCKRVIPSAKRRDGSIWKPAEIAEYSMKSFEKVMCPTCIKQEQSKQGGVSSAESHS